jgi:hypothetical protein
MKGAFKFLTQTFKDGQGLCPLAIFFQRCQWSKTLTNVEKLKEPDKKKQARTKSSACSTPCAGFFT